MISVQLLGGACLRSGDVPINGPPAQRHRIALLTLIVAAWPQPLSRDRAMALLWPERDLANTRRLLNLALHVLRSALGEGAIVSTADAIVLNPSLVSCDLHELRAAISANASERVVQLYTGPLLDGFHLDDSVEFGYWLDEHRGELTHAYIRALLALAEQQGAVGDLHGRAHTCVRLVAADPYSGAYVRRAMHALDAAGDRIGAIRQAGAHARRLKLDLDLKPDPEVVALAEQLRNATERHSSEKAPANDVEAYRLFLQGRQWYIRYTRKAVDRATDYFERAIALDPTFALAYANLAMVYTEFAEAGTIAPDVAYQRAEELARKAMQLDPELGAAYCTMGHLKGIREFDWTGAEQHFKRSLELNPNSSDTYDLYGRLCTALGRYGEALVLHDRARELDPLVHRMDGVTTLLRAGRYADAIHRAEDALELDPDYDRTRATLGWAYFLSGRKDDGIAELERAVAISPENTLWLGQLGEAYGLAGMASKARKVLRELERRARSGYVSPFHFVYVYTGLGDTDRAMDWLERAVAVRTGPTSSIKGSFLLTPLHTHPRFRALLRQMKLE